MKTFIYKNGKLISKDGTIECKMVDGCEYAGKYGTIENTINIPENGKLILDEKDLNYSEDGFYLKFFLLNLSDMQEMCILSGSAFPISLYLRKKDKGKHELEMVLLNNGKERKCKTKKILHYENFHYLEVILYKGAHNNSLYLGFDQEIVWRVIYDSPVINSENNQFLYLGNTEKSSHFKGAIAELEISYTMPQRVTYSIGKLEETGFLEFENKAEALLSQGIELGDLKLSRMKFSPDIGCVYNEYRGGYIVWSPSYRCVFMHFEIFNKYKSLLETEYIGFPMDDEKYDETKHVSYCFFDGGAIFVNYVNGEIFFVDGLTLSEYIQEGFLNSIYGAPRLKRNTLLINNIEVNFTQLSEYTLFSYVLPGLGNTKIAIRNEHLEKFLEIIKNNGVPEEVIEGYKGYNSDVFTKETRYIEAIYLKYPERVGCLLFGFALNNLGGYKADDFMSKFLLIDYDLFNYFTEKDGLNGENDFGKYKFPTGSAVFKGNAGVTHQEFFGGVIARYHGRKKDGSDLILDFNNIRIKLIHIHSGPIDDGPGDNDAELVLKVDLQRNNKYVCKAKKWPSGSENNGGTSYYIVYTKNDADKNHKKDEHVYYDLPVTKADDSMKFHVKVYDYDYASENDYLGSYTFDFNIDNGFGVVANAGIDSTAPSILYSDLMSVTNYTEVPLMHQGKDNRRGLGNIRFTFNIIREEIIVTQEDLDGYFRKYGYWGFANYRSQEKLQRSHFNTVFGVTSGRWYDWIINFWTEVWFEIVSKYFSGKKGNCFGLSTAAIFALHNKGAYQLPLYQYYDDIVLDKENKIMKPAFARHILSYHMYQGGWKHIDMFLAKAIMGEVLIPTEGFDNIKKVISRDKYCLVNLWGGGGHTVLAYKHYGNRIYVADSNHPWKFTDPLDRGLNKDSSYIELTDDAVKKVKLCWFDADLNGMDSKTYDYCFGTPYSVISSPPKVPSWWDIAVGILKILSSVPVFAGKNLIEFFAMITSGDCEFEEVSSDEGSIEVIQIPFFNGDEQTILNVALGYTKGKVEVKLKGKKGKEFSHKIITRNRIVTVEGKFKKDKANKFSIDDFRKTSLLIKNEKTENQEELKVNQKVINRRAISSKVFVAPRHNLYYVTISGSSNKTKKVHLSSCSHISLPKNRVFIGRFDSKRNAIEEAKGIAASADGCKFCCK